MLGVQFRERDQTTWEVSRLVGGLDQGCAERHKGEATITWNLKRGQGQCHDRSILAEGNDFTSATHGGNVRQPRAIRGPLAWCPIPLQLYCIAITEGGHGLIRGRDT